MIVSEALRLASAPLRKAGVDDHKLESEYLVAGVIGVSRYDLFLRGNYSLSDVQITRLKQWIEERSRRKPLAYILGTQPFMDLDLEVTPSVLIPRPETEGLVERVLSVLDRMRDADVADVGTGSGAIALPLARHPNIRSIAAIDRSAGALAVARRNELRNPGRLPIKWLEGDLLEPVAGRHYDLIVANLPYIKTADLNSLQKELSWEPRTALDGGPDGLVFIGKLVNQSQTTLKQGGWLLMEIGFDQKEPVLDMLKTACWDESLCEVDIAGLPRYIRARKA
jgi:release factor glutamine methyltransferase